MKFYVKNGPFSVIDVAAYLLWTLHTFICARVHPRVIRKGLECGYGGGLGTLPALSLSHDRFLEMVSQS